jgi:hypothetical protein
MRVLIQVLIPPFSKNDPFQIGADGPTLTLSEDWRKMNGEQKESRSQALGRVVADLGEGILAPSRIRMGKNLVIYPRSLRPGSRIEVLGETDLPR